jgi:hypothetical protein
MLLDNDLTGPNLDSAMALMVFLEGEEGGFLANE